MPRMTITVNGQSAEAEVGASLARFLTDRFAQSRAGAALDHVVAERNGRIVPRSGFESETLQDGDVLEIVTFVGGG